MSSDTTTTTRLIALAAARFGKHAKHLSPGDDLFDALGIDSLQAMDLLTDLEETFDIEVPDYELQDARTFAALAAVIEARL
ncbi:MAG: acyl carrier protein [Kiritimatiellia bacterium]|jgi:acyl carrier protein